MRNNLGFDQYDNIKYNDKLFPQVIYTLTKNYINKQRIPCNRTEVPKRQKI